MPARSSACGLADADSSDVVSGRGAEAALSLDWSGPPRNISTAQAYIADVTPPEQRSRGMGLIGAAFGLGFIFGPAIGGLAEALEPS